VSTTVAFGSLDASFIIERSKTVAERIPGAFTIILDGLVDLQFLEEPSVVESIVIQSITPSDPVLSRWDSSVGFSQSKVSLGEHSLSGARSRSVSALAQPMHGHKTVHYVGKQFPSQAR
jgi:hypothetical protein